MKRLMLAMVLGISMVFPATEGATKKTEIEIENDAKDCLDGRISMDLSVSLDGEKLNVDPSCRFSFSKKLRSSSGVECRIEAGMCSSFRPKHSFEVNCRDGAKESLTILCPNSDQIVVLLDDSCKKGRSWGKLTVEVAKEKFSFEPSCRFTFDKRFTTKTGLDCTIESGMCSSFSPKNKIEVKCDGMREPVTAAVACPT